jgi:4-hydroxyphenylpyruvate dioxygenase-like putative hemolysin
MKWDLTTQTDGDWNEYRLFRDGKAVAYAKWRLLGKNAELHNSAVESTKSVLVETRRILNEVILPAIKAAGGELVVVCDRTENVDRLRKKYWEFMGFLFTGEVDKHTFAIREVQSCQ